MNRRWSALALIVTAQFMVILDVAIVNVALPSIKSDLGFSQTNLQWVISAYAIVFGGVLLLGGRLADLLGRRRLFVAGLAVFTASSLLCGLAWSEGSLIAFRAVQGLGGALLAPAALSLLMTTFAEGRERNLALGIYGAASGSGAAALVLAFVGIELRSRSPLLPLRIFRLRTLTAANASMAIVGGVAFSEFFLLTLYLQDVLHYSAVESGVAFLGFALAVVLVSNIAQLVVGRFGVRPTLTAGLLTSAVSVAWLARLPGGGHYFWDIFPGFVLGGAGMGLSFVPVTIASLTGVQRSDAGVASGLINTSRQIGGAIGIASVSAIAATSTSNYVHAHTGVTLSSGVALDHGFQTGLYVLTGLLVAGALIAFTLIRPAQAEVETVEEVVALEEATSGGRRS